MTPGLLLVLAQAFNVYQHEGIEDALEGGDYTTALHLIRVNYGLYSEAQLPILEKLGGEYIYTAFEVTRKIYGGGSREAARVYRKIAHSVSTNYEEIADLERLLWDIPEGDSPDAQLDFRLLEAEIRVAILRAHSELPIAAFRGLLGTDSVISMADSKNQALAQDFMFIRRCLRDAARLAEELGRVPEYNRIVSQINGK